MSRLTQKPAVAPLNPWAIGGSNPSYAGTATPVVGNQAFSANPASTPITTLGTGFADSNFSTYVGQKFETSDGRELVLVQNGAVAIPAGKLCQAPTEITAFAKLAITVPTAYPATAGTFQILVTNGATVLKANQYAGGYLIVDAGSGLLGQTLKIASHQAAANGATFVVTLEDPIQVTLTVSATVTLQFNPYNGVLISSHTTLGLPVGATLYALSASTAPTYDGTSGLLTASGIAQYGLIVTKGPTGILIDSLTNVGYPVGPSTNTDGAVNVATLTSSPQIGISGQTQTSGHTGLVYLQL